MSLLLALIVSDGGVTGVAASSQAQASAATGVSTIPNVTGIVSQSQAQTTSATSAYTSPAITGTASSSQTQTSALIGAYVLPVVTGTATSSQAETSNATGTLSLGVDGNVVSSQAQNSSASGNCEVSQVSPQGAARGKSRRVIVTINDEEMHFKDIADLYAFLEQIKEEVPNIAKKQAKRIKTVAQARHAKAPTISISDVSVYLEDIQAQVRKINAQIEKIYRNALIREAQRNIDDEEAILALLME